MKNKLPIAHVAVPFVLQTIAWFLPGWPVAKFFLHFKTFGNDGVDKAFALAQKAGTGVLFCPNHVSEFDPILVLQGLRPFSRAFPMFYVIYTPSVYQDRARFGWRAFLYGEAFFMAWGGHALRAGKKNYAIALAPHVPILNAGKSLMLFPEGTTSTGGVMLPAKGGVGYLVQHAKPVVVPVCIAGLDDLKVSEFWARKRHVSITYGEPMMADALIAPGMSESNPDDCKAIAAKILATVASLRTV